MKTKSDRDANLDKLEAQLNAWRTTLKDAMNEGDKKSRSAIKASRKQMDELNEKIEAAQKRLDAAKAGGGDKWEGFKDDAKDIWAEIGRSFDRLTN